MVKYMKYRKIIWYLEKDFVDCETEKYKDFIRWLQFKYKNFI